MPRRGNSRRSRRKRLRQEHAARHRRRRGDRRRRPYYDHGKAAGRRRSAARRADWALRPFIRTIRWCASSPSPRTWFSARRDGPKSLAGKRQWAAKQLAPYGLEISPDMPVEQLSPSQRQFLEIVKALATNPKILLLDEPTSSLDISGVEKLSAIIRRIVAAGTAVVYVSHRLPEILALAHRVTILRDGVGQGTYDVNERAVGKRSHRLDGRAADRHRISRQASVGVERDCTLGQKFERSAISQDRARRSPRRNRGICRLRRQRAARGAARPRRPRRSWWRGALRRFCRQHQNAARRARRGHSFAQRRSCRGIDISGAGRSREHDGPGPRRVCHAGV